MIVVVCRDGFIRCPICGGACEVILDKRSNYYCCISCAREWVMRPYHGEAYELVERTARPQLAPPVLHDEDDDL